MLNLRALLDDGQAISESAPQWSEAEGLIYSLDLFQIGGGLLFGGCRCFGGEHVVDGLQYTKEFGLV